jgi:hypothetical protein
LFQQIDKRQKRTPSSAALREIAAGKKNDIGERRMIAYDFRVFRRDQPVDPRPRIPRPQFHEHRKCMHHIAQR